MVRRNDSQSKKDEEVKTMDKMFELINSLNALTKAVTALTEKITSEYLNTFETIYDSEKDEPQEITAKEQPTPEQQTVTFVDFCFGVPLPAPRHSIFLSSRFPSEVADFLQ